ncbi:hypothetical protein IVB16_00365 [Bradyrhizobium sp. 183]|uniref:hypothetical protein n=1 Tax=unclassified Bradyrhizobium TaxID=2631580 RepID=UPI001FFEFE25|nr:MULTISPECIES: hypothetical protein [unclassified Bradyrhizobium]UPJ80530.1 hypothetical protein IVB17_00365 [Bradyrhizobium sp. 184]UPJ88324.1 hypothetical protein IVB16_00365 [Bradyrhizobium sp. 183]
MAKKVRDQQTFLDATVGRPLTSEEMLEILNTNCTYEEAKARSHERARIRSAADRIKGRPPEAWPTFDVRWDLSPANFYRVFDGADPDSVEEDECVVIPDVPMANIDAALTTYWHRTAAEVWSIGDPNKAARAIVHWSEGNLMTPPLLVPTSDGQLAITGGNHRLAVARTKGVIRLPILVKSAEQARVRQILKI